MIAAGAFRVQRVQRGRGGTAFSSSIGSYTHRKPYRKGVVCLTVASLILICGSIMTILGATHVFGGSVTIIGMLMMAVAVLLFLFSIRQFLIAKKMRHTEQNLQITHGTVTAMVLEREDELGTLTVVMDTVNIEPRNRRRNSNQDYAPPDYTEATSDFYPETSVGEVIDSTGDLPPPYGPPTYDEVLTDKIKSGERTDEECSEENNENNENSDDNQHNVSHNSEETEEVEATESRPPEQSPRSNEAVGYQDLPTVTI